MSEEKVDVQQEGSIFLVDPNPAGRGVVPAEDLFIYVKLTATERNRGVYNLDSSSNPLDTSNIGEINFIATEVTYDKSGEPFKDVMGNVKTYATTNYTDIGGIQNSYSSGALEGFGVKSINIRYNASLVPQVDISFIDVRGGSLFDVIEQDNRKSPYSIFFKMPYPIFKLTVKGYFGLPVDYCLHLTDWNSKFDPSTGNFEIDAKFLGFQQAFLADITLGNVLGVMNTKEGVESLSKIPMKNGQPTPTLDKFVKDISKLQIDLERLKNENSSYKKLEKLNTLRAKIKNISDFIGKPLNKDGGSLSDDNYQQLKNDPLQIVTTGIKSPSLGIVGEDYLSIRDYLIIPVTSTKSLDEYMITLYTLLDDYRQYFTINKNSLPEIKGIINGDSLDINIYKISKQSVGNLINYDGLKIINTATTQAALDLLKVSDILTKPNDINGDFDPFTIEDDEFIRSGQATPSNIVGKDVVMILDFSQMRAEINRMLIDIDKLKTKEDRKVTNELNDTLSKSLDFNPTVGTVFEIICNNVQALIDTTYDVAYAAETKSTARAKALQKAGGVVTDINVSSKNDFSNSTIYAFPKIIKNDKEMFIGDKSLNFKDNDFPEKKFINDVVAGITEKSSELEDIRKNANILTDDSNTLDNWVPINLIDYKDNPFYSKFNSMSNSNKFYKEFYKTLLVRYAVLKNYSGVDSNIINQYGIYDGIIAKKSIFEPVIRAAVTKNLQSKSAQQIIMESGTAALGNITVQDKSLNPNKIFKIGDIEITPVKDDAIYVGIDNKGILQSKLSLPEDISDLQEYKEMFITNNPIRQTTERWTEWTNNLVIDNISYNCWFPEVNGNLQTTSSNSKGNNTFLIPKNDITLIDGGTSPTEDAINNNKPNTPPESLYINIFNKNKKIKDKTGTEVTTESLLTKSEFYSIQSNDNYGKALLLLSTFPLWGFDYMLDKIIKGQRDKIVRVPKLFLLFMGGSIWRSTFTSANDPIEWESPTINYKKLESIKISGSDTINLLGFYDGDTIKTYRGNCPQILIDLPKATKQIFINYFKDWVDNYFVPFEDLVISYSEENSNDITKWKNGVQLTNTYIRVTSDLAIYAPKIFNAADPGLDNSLSIEGFGDYYNSFIENFADDISQSNTTPAAQDQDEKNKQLNPLKLQAYNYFKAIYDKWIAGSAKEDLSYNACGQPGKNLFDYFRFINRGFNDIGDIACVNLDSVINLTNNLETNIYFYLSKILRDNNFLLQILPNYINFKDPTEVAKMFKPITNISDRNTSSGPTYLCIYAAGTSENLNINEQSRYSFTNDGFSLTNPPPDMVDEKEFNLVAFRVSFGSENQSLFKSVSLNQQEHRQTGEYIRTLSDLVDKRGGTQRVFQGTDLYSIFKTRSYTCNVESLGCMNIQPMMYFQLDNVPFFDGAYMVLNVTHDISPNHMTTTFTGVRQSNLLTPPVDKITTFLDLDLDQVEEGSTIPKLSNYTNQDKDRYNIGIDVNKGPDDVFNMDELNQTFLEYIGVKSQVFVDNPNLVDNLSSQFTAYGINSKSNVTMLLANMLTISNYFSKSVEVWPVGEEGTLKQQTYYTPNNIYGHTGTTVEERRGDAYIHRAKGYIPILGRNSYTEFLSWLKSADWNIVINEIYTNQISSKTAILISIYVWKTATDSNGKTPYQYSTGGSASNFNQTTNALYSIPNPTAQNNTIKASFNTWAKVLNGLDILGININNNV